MSSLPDRVMRELTDAGDVRRALDTRRVMHDRDLELEVRRSELYEELRKLSTAELVARAYVLSRHVQVARAALIADIIDRELSELEEGSQ